MNDNNQTSTQLLSYRNAYYHGQTKNGQRHGYGLLILDSGVILVARWKNDILQGRAAAFINAMEYALLEFNQGELDGYCAFKSPEDTLVVQFNNGRPIDKQILVKYTEKIIKILTFRNSHYQILLTIPLENNNQSKVSQQHLGIQLNPPPIIEFLQKQFCNAHQQFQIKHLSNDQILFTYNDRSSPISLGFSVKNRLVSYGLFINGKLNGFGYKFDKHTRYQGYFQGGMLNGYGMRFSNNRYSFGRFQENTLVDPLFLQQKPNTIQEKIRQLRKKDHIQSQFFCNDFVPKTVIRFRGISEITNNAFNKEYLFHQTNQLANSTLKGSNVSLNQIISGKGQKLQRQPDTTSLLYNSSASRSRYGDDQDDVQLFPRRNEPSKNTRFFLS